MNGQLYLSHFNTLRPRQHGRHFAADTFKRIFMFENVIISIKISLKFVPKGPITNIPALVQIMAWRRPGDKPLSEAMMVSLLTHICVTRPQWVNYQWRIHCCLTPAKGYGKPCPLAPLSHMRDFELLKFKLKCFILSIWLPWDCTQSKRKLIYVKTRLGSLEMRKLVSTEINKRIDEISVSHTTF